MFDLPPSLARHFRDPAGRIDYHALLRTPDEHLVRLARQMPEGEWADLYGRLWRFRPGFLERMMASAAGIDVELQRRRFLAVLEAAAPVPA